jgi:hypothetical protein
MDKLKEHIQNIKAELDNREPQPQVWNAIENKLQLYKPDFLKQAVIVSQQRKGLDLHEPPEQVWVNIAKQTKPSSNKVIWLKIGKYAAAAAVVGLAMFGLVKIIMPSQQVESPGYTVKPPTIPQSKPLVDNSSEKNKTNNKLVQSNVTPIIVNKNLVKNKQEEKKAFDPASKATNVTNVSNEFTEMDKSYGSMVKLQIDKLSNTPIIAENTAYYASFIEQYKQVQQDEKALKEKVKTLGFTEDDLQTLININQYKLGILKELQQQIKKTNGRFKMARKTTDSASATFLKL